MSVVTYLSRIQLSQFRSFAKLDVALLPAPGVLVVHGSNGLGKSSLFDGLEWALTDKIDHYRNVKGSKRAGKYLRRWRAPTDQPTKVALTFSDGGHIERSLASHAATESKLLGTVDDIANYLKAAQWSQEITDLTPYLLLTHFLGQSTLSRFTHRDSSERFDILKEAAQSRDVESLAAAIHGEGNTAVVQAFARRSNTLTEESAGLVQLLAREATLWEGANVSGAIDDVEAHVITRKILDYVGPITVVLGSDGAKLSPRETAEVPELQQFVDGVRSYLRAVEAQVERGRLLVENWQNHGAKRVSLQAAVEEATAQSTKDTIELQTASLDAAALGDRLSQARANVGVLSQKLDHLARFVETRNGLEIALGEYERAEVALKKSELAYETASQSTRRLQRRQRIVARLAEESTVLADEIKRLLEDHRNLNRWFVRESELASLRSRLIQLEAEFPNIEGTVVDAQATLSALQNARAALAQAVDSARTSVGVISNAVAAIAANLPHDGCDCPVCATTFSSSDELRARAATAADRLAPMLFRQEEALSSITQQCDGANAKLTQLREAQLRMLDKRSGVAAAEAEHVALGNLVAHLNVEGSSQQALALLASRTDAMLERRTRRMRWMQRLDHSDGVSISDQSVTATRRRDDADGARSEARRVLSEAGSAIRRLQAERESLAEEVGIVASAPAEELDLAIVSAQHAHEDAAREAESIRQLAENATNKVDHLKVGQASATAAREQLVQQLKEVEVQFTKMQADWASLQTGAPEPSFEAIDAMAERLVSRRRDVAEASDLLVRLRDGRAAWSKQTLHLNALEELRGAVDAAPNAGRDELRGAVEHRVTDLQREIRATFATKNVAQAASKDVLSSLQEFNAEYIRPLDTLMKRINQAILTDPRVGIELQVKKKRIEQSAQKGNEVPSAVGDLDPFLVHSEGQMSAMAVSLLCAASLSFPWSRWPALVLDDPLQHNDAIHTSAFADMVSNLVVEKGYQVFLSTHDLARSEFLQRKFFARRIPCAFLALQGEGAEGVETSYYPARSPEQRSMMS